MSDNMLAAKKDDSYLIFGKLNIVIYFASVITCWFCLSLASHSTIIYMLLAAFIFSLVHNTLFSLMHEAAHGIFSKNKFINEFFGIILGAAFPTSFTMQKIAHLGHHKRNRTDKELYDYYLPSQSKKLRDFWMYAGNLFGLYWFCIPFSNLIIISMPMIFKSKWFIHGPAKVLGFEAYLEEIAQYSIVRIWLEAVLALFYQIMLWYILDLSWQGMLLCYWFFALHWSALPCLEYSSVAEISRKAMT